MPLEILALEAKPPCVSWGREFRLKLFENRLVKSIRVQKKTEGDEIIRRLISAHFSFQLNPCHLPCR